MKKFILLIGLLLCMCSCTVEVDANIYHVEMTYRIDNGDPKTESFDIVFKDMYYPVYSYTTGLQYNLLYVSGKTVSGLESEKSHLIYKGPLRVDVVEFNYKVIKKVKVSALTGRIISSED